MTHDKINALLATSYNLHVQQGKGMTPAEAAELSRPDKVALAYLLREKGSSQLYSQVDADEAYIALTSSPQELCQMCWEH
ncbi:hypothetical protein ACMHYJ_06330 [Castellaniella hirudinis]|uniref:hypothetical protein n=1 Tax=Castellaniella hirudinis TaxID=1144617 RepID=UPI0039C3850F